MHCSCRRSTSGLSSAVARRTMYCVMLLSFLMSFEAHARNRSSGPGLRIEPQRDELERTERRRESGKTAFRDFDDGVDRSWIDEHRPAVFGQARKQGDLL